MATDGRGRRSPRRCSPPCSRCCSRPAPRRRRACTFAERGNHTHCVSSTDGITFNAPTTVVQRTDTFQTRIVGRFDGSHGFRPDLRCRLRRSAGAGGRRPAAQSGRLRQAGNRVHGRPCRPDSAHRNADGVRPPAPSSKRGSSDTGDIGCARNDDRPGRHNPSRRQDRLRGPAIAALPSSTRPVCSPEVGRAVPCAPGGRFADPRSTHTEYFVDEAVTRNDTVLMWRLISSTGTQTAATARPRPPAPGRSSTTRRDDDAARRHVRDPDRREAGRQPRFRPDRRCSVWRPVRPGGGGGRAGDDHCGRRRRHDRHRPDEDRRRRDA